MTPRHWRPVRGARVLLALVRVLPRYLVLMARDRGRRRPSQADWDRAHTAAAREIRDVALALAGAFNKVAQLVGSRADVLPRAFVDELSQFQDAVPPRPFEELRPIVERDLGAPIDALFARFDPEPIGSASLAQVHRATRRDGTEVAVKIQYPEVRRLIPTDLATIRGVATLVNRLQPYVDVRTLSREVTSNLALELDFVREARSTQRMTATLADQPFVRIPAVHDDLQSANVLVLEYLDGIPIARTEALVAAGHSLAETARRVGALYGVMIFERDFFHGDPHPGNLLVLPDGTIGLLDFGLCKALPKGFARDLAEMMVCAMVGDSPAALAAADRLGFEIESLEAEHLRTLMLMAVGDSVGDASFVDIVTATRIRKFPDDLALVLRTLILLNGLSHRLLPGRRLLQAELLKHLAAGAARDRRAA